MPRRRQSFEPGHARKFLVVVDETPECDRALYYAARRASRTGGGVVMLTVMDLADASSQWLGVGDLMRAEASEQANARLEHFAARVRRLSGVEPERVLREGKVADEVVRLIEADEDIAILVLAAATGSEGPGPLIAALASGSAAHGAWPRLLVPITLVPGSLTDDEIDALA
ncbi:universal stress protein [Ancylobacter sp. 6x-1]|uniref:Universal stress protein n=2 Tax=Ancylobacter crimeensis TaxID=2579147 RepID=A0ABT0DDG4_9HYPH|nr:universal stress protein [Ancylobacter crimeensis]MCK0198010.1 universal stress protein [Ancylobacter crimeensis]